MKVQTLSAPGVEAEAPAVAIPRPARSNINFLESLSVAVNALRANKIRSILTMLGIIIGVGAVIAMIALGQGARKAVEDSISALGTNLLMINPGSARQGMVRLGAGSSIRLNEDDLKAIQTKVTGIQAIAPELSRFGQLKYDNKNWNARVVGTTPDYEFVRNARLEKGTFFTRQDDALRQRVAMVGPTVVENLFEPEEDPVGKQIKINNISFAVIGVLKAKGQQGWMNQDDIVVIPLQTAQKRLLGLDFFTNINVQVADISLMEQVSMDIEQVLRRSHRLTGQEENDFSIRNQSDIMATRTETAKTLTYLLASVAFVSLMVGGIGIMNIMLVSVTERTREIGVRRALGARKRDVLAQFLTEAITLSLVGGIIGIGLGVGATILMSKLAGWSTLISSGSILLAFIFSATVGIFFGLYPAKKAASLNPIEALRYE
ncbi:MAG: ABC transporter permease [candidate division Zixibacteria bacterium]|nr:ABC transporter permease [candidate division Zixibacteria bacterium]